MHHSKAVTQISQVSGIFCDLWVLKSQQYYVIHCVGNICDCNCYEKE